MAKVRKRSKSLKTNLKFELYGILILIFSVITLALQGPVGRSLSYLFRFFVGTWDFVGPLLFIYIGLYVMMKRAWPPLRTARKFGLLLFLLGLLVSSHISIMQQWYPGIAYSASDIVTQTWNSMMQGLKPTVDGQQVLTHDVGGGMIGALLYAGFYALFDNLGARLIEFTLFVIGFVMATGLSFVELGSRVGGRFRWLSEGLQERLKQLLRDRHQAKRKAGTDAVKKPVKAAVPYIPPDDEFDEEELPAIKKPRKTPTFFQLLQNPNKAKKEAQSAPPEWDEPHGETEEVVYRSDAADRHAPEPAAAANDDQIPVIRDFQDHYDDAPGAGAAPAAVMTAAARPKSATAVASRAGGDDDGAVTVEFAKDRPDAVHYELPSLSLLAKPPAGKGSEMSDYKANARKLEATLESFGVRAKVLEVVRGPAVTRYEIQPDVGVKVSRIVSLTDDIALALAAKDIRMEAPIPGKSAIGIEVPNTEVSVVTMREVMETAAFQESASRLSITLGRDISGQPIVGNLARMPHLLVAGATGSGKSVCINGIITSILYKAKPNEVKFLMIDPKMVELNVYNGIPHLLAPVVTDPRRASLALKKVVLEMEKRYELFSKSGTRNIEGYNAMLTENGTEAPLPYYVVIVDELADLMMVAANDVEDSICRLAQMARAAGIHLIIATQRPSVDVITGVIKANIPSRIAFGVSSQVDSRTILDMVGAEKLLGRGDMLYLPVGASKPIRVQGAFLSDQEVEAVVSFVRKQEQANYQEEMVPQVEEQAEANNEYEDELYDQAVQIVLEAKQASVSLLQRRMRIGYTRAARLIDYMEAKGVVGPYEGSKPREVLMSLEQYHHNRMTS
ncbi:cell division protein FtsK [Gordoniibacillus kamchatkensis]|uniref:Cell division protein FtsK n=1 Tax=Gordoniibacillus kamchatkensis TaxID=1590651 RepID=A0ABR5AK32_9BACL|nr:DNA translocase FtsK [Paenibacillus sp. VKM B-2647]KIL41396.1 cell division protein FtsK [Paenibacillus sp. VKM B-2647]